MIIEVTVAEGLWLADLMARVLVEPTPHEGHHVFAESVLASLRDEMGMSPDEPEGQVA